MGPLKSRDEHGGQQRGAAGEDRAVDGDDNGRALQVLQLGMLDLAIDLGQGFLAAHGQNRVTEGHQNAEQTQDRQSSAAQKAQGILVKMQVRWDRRGRQVGAAHKNRE